MYAAGGQRRGPVAGYWLSRVSAHCHCHHRTVGEEILAHLSAWLRAGSARRLHRRNRHSSLHSRHPNRPPRYRRDPELSLSGHYRAARTRDPQRAIHHLETDWRAGGIGGGSHDRNRVKPAPAGNKRWGETDFSLHFLWVPPSVAL